VPDEPAGQDPEGVIGNLLQHRWRPDLTYPDFVIEMRTGDTLTLLFDGVVEARDRSGELFGFERTQAISCLPAGEIAAAARQFGQEDDITVLTFTFLPRRDPRHCLIL
jgi:hypothetical protein